MRVGMWPFYSQQDKAKGRFLFDSCWATKMTRFLVGMFHQEGWHSRVAAPHACWPYDHRMCQTHHVTIPMDNRLQRISWPLDGVKSLFDECDLAFVNHELMSIPIRVVYPDLPIVQMCFVKPDSYLFPASLESADLAVAQSLCGARELRRHTNTPVVRRPLSYDETRICTEPLERDIDVLFVNRCSADNSTHHREFLLAMEHLQELRVRFTDPTGQLRRERPDLSDAMFLEPKDYYRNLRRARVAVAMHGNMHAGVSIVEAIRSGCVPVVHETPWCRELVGEAHPFVVDAESPTSIAATVHLALRNECIGTAPFRNAGLQSFQSVWPTVWQDIQEVMSAKGRHP